MLHVGMASNSDWVVPATRDERRFLVLDVADNRIGDRQYFTAIVEQMKAGGLAGLIYDMLQRDISEFEVRDIPDTEALDDQKRLSLDSLDRWLIAVLERGFVWRSRYGVSVFSEWHEFVTTELLNRSYQQWCDDSRFSRPMPREQLGRRLVDIYQPVRPRGGQVIGEVESARPSVTDPDQLVARMNRAPGYQFGTPGRGARPLCRSARCDRRLGLQPMTGPVRAGMGGGAGWSGWSPAKPLTVLEVRAARALKKFSRGAVTVVHPSSLARRLPEVFSALTTLTTLTINDLEKNLP